jgi:flavorubredoxin
VTSLTGHYHKDWNFSVVKTGDRLSLGSRELIFVEAPMLHWPDSMFCYLTEDNILFSNDAFGQHYATEVLYNDKVDQFELMVEALKYYANILTPFSKLVRKKIDEFLSLQLPLDIICTSHGVIWRDNPLQIVEKYLEWSNDYQENQITIIYDTMWNGTRALAESIAEGLTSTSPDVTVKLYNSAKTDKNDIVAEVFKSKAIVVGSPTINRGILTSIAGLMEEIRGLGFRGKKAAAFGTYGWSGESTNQVAELLDRSGFSVVADGFKAKWNPDDQAKRDATEHGRMLAAQFKL